MENNLMPKIAEMLGVKLGERFQVYDPKHGVVQNWCEYMLTKDGVVQCWLNPSELPEEGATVVDLECLICGGFKVVKLPEFPKRGDIYYMNNVATKTVEFRSWVGDVFDLAMKTLCMVYRTKEEAEANMSKDCERLTGRKLKNDA